MLYIAVEEYLGHSRSIALKSWTGACLQQRYLREVDAVTTSCR
jgi:hypothetical protein